MPTKVIRELIANHIEWIILLLLFPFVVTISPRTSLLMVITLIPFFIRYVRGKSFLPSTPFNLSLFGLLLMIIFSVWATYDISFSLRKVVSLTWGIFLFWSLHNSLKVNEQNKFWLAGLICLLGFFVSIFALFNPVISLRIPGGTSIFTITSLVPGSTRLQEINPNEIGGILAWCIPLSYSFNLFFFQRSRQKQISDVRLARSLLVLLITPLIPMLGILYYTSSRTAIGGVSLSLVFITWLLVGMKIKGKLSAIISISIVILLVFAFLTNLSDPTKSLFTINEILAGENSNFSLETLNQRVEVWSRALYGIQDFPFTGMGMNTFREVVRVLYPLFLIPPDIDIAHAHNQFLQTALDLGIPGLIFYISIWLVSVFLLVKSWKNAVKGSRRQALIAGLAGAMLASFIFGLTDAIALGAIPSFVFWLLLSIVSNLYLEVTNLSLDS